ncbi:hypothetical protein V1J52_00775 [Streptomyces sp. TRM 70351]|uniref:hypothetical protein n=1 Tax=Streptomyces sp. TRM 70351 TaxID=3116552 RepID=UPI002E7AC794|nr:hypothetical protein [Streptomyces sp. TRM 70351]MEE1926727.1 hypothetical protein [Streptomyces sp. TRM 70351]
MTAQKTPGGRRTAGALDIRLFIALLLGIYGAVLTVTGAVASDADIAKAAGLNINLWSGLALLTVAAAFTLWTRLRPVVVPEEPEAQDSPGGDGPA